MQSPATVNLSAGATVGSSVVGSVVSGTVVGSSVVGSVVSGTVVGSSVVGSVVSGSVAGGVTSKAVTTVPSFVLKSKPLMSILSVTVEPSCSTT